MKIAFVTSEVVPYSKSGGLADVCGSLPAALRNIGADVLTVTPLHRSAKNHSRDDVPVQLEVPLGGVTIRPRISRSGQKYFIEYDPFFDRDELYGTSEGEYEDNAARFTFFCRAAIDLLQKLGPPDLVHAHDWQAGLVPVYARTLYPGQFRTLFTIHNLAYQGLFGTEHYDLTGLDRKHYYWKELEYHGSWSFLKGGLIFSDAISTVSPTYAEEIQTEISGMGMQGVLRERKDRLHGILNGIDVKDWDPLKDPHLVAPYSKEDRGGKRSCKRELQKWCGLPVADEIPVLGMVARLVEQKGLEIVISAMDEMMREDLQFVVLGSGEIRFHKALKALSLRYPGKFSLYLGFDNGLAHQVEAGADMFLMPSRFEPCGLNQMYSLRYGTVPIVRNTGGLSDTVIDGVTGIQFSRYSPKALMLAIRRALDLYRDKPSWERMVTDGMAQDFSWDHSAREYLRLYENLLQKEA